MKRIFLIFGLIITFIYTNLAVQASSNYLRTITLEKSTTGYNVILNTDRMAKIVRRTPSENELILELSGISSKDTVNALYKGTGNIESLVIENTSPSKLKVYITAPNIKESSIIMQPIGGSGELVAEEFPLKKVLWTIFVLALFGVIFRASKKSANEDSKIFIKQDIKDREIALYRRYRKDIENMDINSRKSMKMKSILKKIDRKIDERLTTASLK